MIPSGIQAYQRRETLSSRTETGISGTRHRPEPTLPKAARPEPTRQTPSGDRVTLSLDVTMARIREGLGLPPSGPISPPELDHARSRATARVDSALDRILTSVGIPTATTFHLIDHPDGEIRVSGLFPNRRRLEGAINRDPSFENLFRKATSHLRLDRWVRAHASSDGKRPALAPTNQLSLLKHRADNAYRTDGIPFATAMAAIEGDTEPVVYPHPGS